MHENAIKTDCKTAPWFERRIGYLDNDKANAEQTWPQNVFRFLFVASWAGRNNYDQIFGRKTTQISDTVKLEIIAGGDASRSTQIWKAQQV